jgi:hypothetical protein
MRATGQFTDKRVPQALAYLRPAQMIKTLFRDGPTSGTTT